MSITVLATFNVKADKVEQFLEACRELTENTLKDKGVESYELQRNSDDASHFVFVERWATKDDLDAHLKTAHIAKAFPILLECCESELSIQLFEAAL